MRLITTNRYAAVTATLALFLSLGGTSYAVGSAVAKNSVGSKQIVNGSVKSADIGTGAVARTDLGKNAVDSSKVADNTLTGADVKESTLGTVPSATNASNAAKVGGQSVYKVRFVAGSPTLNTAVFDAGGLRITATCLSNVLSLVATTTKPGSSIYASATTDGGTTVRELDYEDGSFGTTFANFDLLAGSPGNISLITFTYEAPDGIVATGTLTADTYSAGGCHSVGHITIG